MSFQKQTLNLAKALYFIKISMEYIDHIRKDKDVAYNGKHTMNIIYGKLNGSINEIKMRLGDEFAVMFVSHKNCFVDFDNQQYSLDSVEYFIPIVRPNSPIY